MHHDEVEHRHHEPRTGWRCALATVRAFLGLGGQHEHHHGHPLPGDLEDDRRGVKAVVVSLVALGVTAAFQLVVALVTGSVALLSDTLHNLADAGTSLPLWVAFVVGRRRPNRRFTYGYARAEDLAGLVVLAVIAASAGLAAWQAVERLLDPHAPRHLWAVAAAGVLGALGNEAVARYRIRVGHDIGSAALVADGLHARTDALTSLGVVVGAAGVAVGFALADPLVGLVIAAVIVRILIETARDLLLRLLDGIEPGLVDRVEEVARSVDGVLDIGQVRLRWLGHRLHGEVEVAVAGDLTVADGHEVAEAVRHELLHEVPHLSSAIVHADPVSASGIDPHLDLAHHQDPLAATDKEATDPRR
ncbi:MAG: cation diffusion facilitator family transporter [Actinobacteria bacterium]|nr:cation diffusion facilitator family transporter [Actinomycetota bacterium]